MRFWDYGSSSDDDAVLDELPPSIAAEIEAERRRAWLRANDTRSEAERKRAAAERARLAYVRYSPHSQSREILVLLGTSGWGSLSFDLCRRCRRGHVWSLSVLRAMQNEGLEMRMLRMARTKANEGDRWTRSGAASRAAEFWDHIPRELTPELEEPCEHLRQYPGPIRGVWASVRYWRVTGHFHWPASREERAAHRRRAADRR